MTYKIRPGITLIEVCGAPILVAQREIWDDFPMIQPIPKIGAIVWRMLEIERPWNRVLYICSSLSRSTPEDSEPRLRSLCDSLVKEGFLTEVPDDNDGHDVD